MCNSCPFAIFFQPFEILQYYYVSIIISFITSGNAFVSDAPFIFDPYFSKKPDGVGLGLTIVGELVTENNGILELLREGPLALNTPIPTF
jgi:hypothetical protein